MRKPKYLEEVEIFVNDKWIEATFYDAGTFTDNIGTMTWCDYFIDKFNELHPKEPLTGIGDLPEWRFIKGNKL